MSPFPKHSQKWLKNAEAAKALAVDVRTIKRWMKGNGTREALSAIRHGKQRRIPLPDNISLWESQTRERLKRLGIHLKMGWECELDELGKQCDRYLLESYRLWLAAYGTVLERGRITQEARDGILLLWRTACEILEPLPRHEMQVEKLKTEFRARLLARGVPKEKVGAVLSRWPKKRHFDQVRAAHTLDELEVLRRRLDYTQAIRELKELGQKPTTKNIGPLLYKDFVAHINDTREKLLRIVVKNPTEKEARRISMAGVCDQVAGEKAFPVTLDLRQPQRGLARRTVQKRHPQKRLPQKAIVAEVHQIRDSIPGVEEKSQTGKTPVRKSVDDVPLAANARLQLKRRGV